MQQSYASEIQEGKLDIFCVSNLVYEKYCRKGNHELVDASGVIELRRFCHAITAEAQLRDAQHYLDSSLASLLTSLGLWAGSRLPAIVEPVVIFTDTMETSLRNAREKVISVFPIASSKANTLRRLVSPSFSFDKTLIRPSMNRS